MNNQLVLVRLSVMMFLQFFIWGAWYVTTGNFMLAHAMTQDQVGWAYSVVPIAAIISPFVLGLIVDRFFASQVVLGVLHLLGGAAMLALPSIVPATPAGFDPADADSARLSMGETLPFLALLFVHALCYTPTLSLVNTVGFSNMTRPEKEFPIVRVLGTIGWIVAGLVVGGLLAADVKTTQYYVAGGASLLLGLYSFTLPHTPPPSRGKAIGIGEILGVDAWKLLARPSFAVFLICSMLLCIPLAAYYQAAQTFVGEVLAENFRDAKPESSLRSPAAWMTIGQMSEILFMLMIPLVFNRLGVKVMLLIGMAAWIVRYTLFAFADVDDVLWMTLVGVALHGICFDFFFVTGFIYTEKTADPAIRGQAQGMLVMATQGIGLFVGAQLTSALLKACKAYAAGGDVASAWYPFWLINAGMAAVVTVIFAAAFWDRVTARADDVAKGETAAPIDPQTVPDPARRGTPTRS